jgi:hypothetical protein
VALYLGLVDVTPFLPPLSAAQTTRVNAWLPVLELLLDGRYGEEITTERRPLFVSTAADAIERRLSKPAGLIDSQAVGSANVRYNARAGLAVWFLPEELAQLDDVAGFGRSVRFVRTPAPDAIRFGNTMGGAFDELSESDTPVET